MQQRSDKFPLCARASRLLENVLADASRPEPADSQLLSINHHACGRILASRLPFLKSLPELFARRFAFSPGRVELTLSDDLLERNDFLARLASYAYEQGEIRKWRNELLDIRDFSGTVVLGQAERTFFRLLGLTTYCVHAAARSADGRIFLARRSRRKSVSPGLWDTLAGGMVSAGESWETSLKREIDEEAGLAAEQFELLAPAAPVTVLRPVPEGWMREVSITYPVLVADGAEPRNRDGEVECFELVSPDEAVQRIEQGKVTVEASIALLSLPCFAEQNDS
jgi:8-oxo-dGTP pyrophosphatase MutT (NUDIX family)